MCFRGWTTPNSESYTTKTTVSNSCCYRWNAGNGRFLLLLEEILHQLVGSLSHYCIYRLFHIAGGCFGISSINSRDIYSSVAQRWRDGVEHAVDAIFEHLEEKKQHFGRVIHHWLHLMGWLIILHPSAARSTNVMWFWIPEAGAEMVRVEVFVWVTPEAPQFVL